MALVFLRAVAFVVAWPIFGVGQVPVSLKVLFAIVLTMTLFPVVHFAQPHLIQISSLLVLQVIREVVVGLFLGYLLRAFFYTISVGGEIIGITSGLSSAQLFNPQMGSQTNVLEQLHLMMATLFLLAMNGHHLFLQGFAQSFDLIPVGALGLKHEGFSAMALIARDVFVMGVKMASPLIVAVFITNLTMGLLGRAVPQLNVMMTGFQVTICVAFVVLFIGIPFFVDQMNITMQNMFEHFFSAMKVL